MFIQLMCRKVGSDLHIGFPAPLRPRAVQRRRIDGRKDHGPNAACKFGRGPYHDKDPVISHELHGKSKAHRSDMQEDGPSFGFVPHLIFWDTR